MLTGLSGGYLPIPFHSTAPPGSCCVIGFPFPFPFPLFRKDKMSSLGTSKGILEIAKFGVYVTVPIILMYTFANNPANLRKFMGNRSYIEYPTEAERPPSPEELREMARKRNSS